MNWQKQFVRPVPEAARENPTALFEVLATRAEYDPALIPLFTDAIGEMARFYAETAEGVRATSQLQNLADRGRRWKALND
jgi:hypothetical protein